MMRKAFVDAVTDLIEKDPSFVLLLGDIGVYGFRDVFLKHPSRIYNIGILEQSTISVAAGLALGGMIPTVHTIAPFIVERAYEQLKIDFGYQKLGGNFISVGASYDYAGLGCTHHCPGDVAIISKIPGFEVIVPGSALEFKTLYSETYDDGKPTYIRLSEAGNEASLPVEFGKVNVVARGGKGAIIAVGPVLDRVRVAIRDMDLTLAYVTTLKPFDLDALDDITGRGDKPCVIVEPFYQGTTLGIIASQNESIKGNILNIGVPDSFLHAYGSSSDHDSNIGMHSDALRDRITRFFQNG